MVFQIHKKKNVPRQSELEPQEKNAIDTSNFSIGGWEAMMFMIFLAFIISFFYLNDEKFNIAVILSIIWSLLFLFLIFVSVRSKKNKKA